MFNSDLSMVYVCSTSATAINISCIAAGSGFSTTTISSSASQMATAFQKELASRSPRYTISSADGVVAAVSQGRSRRCHIERGLHRPSPQLHRLISLYTKTIDDWATLMPARQVMAEGCEDVAAAHQTLERLENVLVPQSWRKPARSTRQPSRSLRPSKPRTNVLYQAWVTLLASPERLHLKHTNVSGLGVADNSRRVASVLRRVIGHLVNGSVLLLHSYSSCFLSSSSCFSLLPFFFFLLPSFTQEPRLFQPIGYGYVKNAWSLWNDWKEVPHSRSSYSAQQSRKLSNWK